MKTRSALHYLVGTMSLITIYLTTLLIRFPKSHNENQREGYWGAKTATMNWCEDDYEVTPYIAEFFNAMSSLLIVCNGLFGIMAHRGAVFWETRWLFAFGILFVVGFGSFAFHATLWKSMQALDELPMIYGNTIFIYCVLTMEDKRGMDRTPLAATLCVLTLAETAFIVWFDTADQIAFLVFYGAGVIFLILKTLALSHKHDPQQRSHLHLYAIMCYSFGYILWNLSRTFCATTKPLHLHAWWHFFAGLGTFLAVINWMMVRGKTSNHPQHVKGFACTTRIVTVV